MSTQSRRDSLVTIFGGSGFVGRHLVRALARRGYRVRVAVRRPELAGHLQPLGMVGQIHAVQANLRHAGSVAAAMRGADVAVNLVGILFERARQRFDAVHAHGGETVAQATAGQRARLIHVSALGADERSASLYARSKAMGERLVLAAMPSATIMRPSVIFGPEDDFFNRFAALARISPILPLVGGGATRLQPIFVGDVAEAIACDIDGARAPGTTYELGGPQIFTFAELMHYVLATVERRRLLVPLPFWLARLQAKALQYLPRPPLTPDQVELLKTDTVVSTAAANSGRTLAAFDIEPRTVAAIVPTYLWRYRRSGQFRNRSA
ncbi:MAG: complex I NDUFA9 subunit family protein [Proteobacteria bacterium]|nr:complex I NDUFA9 subunit family protein [Pseudomonadota bacterium]